MLPASLLRLILTWTVPAMGAVISTNTMSDFQRLRVGYPFDVTWEGAIGDVTISLLLSSGTTVVTIGSALPGSSFSWTPPALSTTDTYVLQFVDSTQAPSRSISFDVTAGGVAGAQAVSASPAQVSSEATTSSLTPASESQTSSTRSGAPPTMTTSVSSSTAVTPTPSLPATTSVTPTPIPASPKRVRLSTEAKIGMSVGAVVGAFLVIVLVALASRNRRRGAARKAKRRVDDEGRPADGIAQPAPDESGPRWEKGVYDPSSTGSRNNLLKQNDGGSSDVEATRTGGRRGSRPEPLTVTEGINPRTDVISALSDGTISQPSTGGRASQLSIHTDGRTSRIGRFEFEESPEPRGFSGGIRVVEMEDLKI
ncbi:hypothetical protein QTJ16_004162 [Diplocarpon rosae]|uniref:Uncharacterized protein n=1 Tax=Diplocarpon rosae TaxID=946125 RepID=A0AAD9WCY9_9HELO|nr:hypothetical protein QTJ16_004162 [Diplocarpon rosae]